MARSSEDSNDGSPMYSSSPSPRINLRFQVNRRTSLDATSDNNWDADGASDDEGRFTSQYIHSYRDFMHICTCMYALKGYIHLCYLILLLDDTYIDAYINIYIHTYIHTVQKNKNKHTYIHTYIHANMKRTYIHIYIHTFLTYIHTVLLDDSSHSFAMKSQGSVKSADTSSEVTTHVCIYHASMYVCMYVCM